MPDTMGDSGGIETLWGTRLTLPSYRVCILIDLEDGQCVSEQNKQVIA